ncbi:MAG: prepilin-type N-terminal cleavage/methylation domain-containing protein [Fibrobacteres bacterium]|nr:prepilin-type N-terminal cleavage/methylation domain-containing protein [Fibrobacterota bacterium]
MRRQGGFTIIELAVALTVLSAGSAVLWYGLRSASRLDRLNRAHHAALLLARSDLESLRALPKTDIHDTAYLGQGAGAESLLVVRRVMDSARIMNTLGEVTLDEDMSPRELRKPLEVRVRVYRAPLAEGGGFAEPSRFQEPSEPSYFGPSDDEGPGGPPHAMATLTLKLPEYKWW